MASHIYGWFFRGHIALFRVRGEPEVKIDLSYYAKELIIITTYGIHFPSK